MRRRFATTLAIFLLLVAALAAVGAFSALATVSSARGGADGAFAEADGKLDASIALVFLPGGGALLW